MTKTTSSVSAKFESLCRRVGIEPPPEIRPAQIGRGILDLRLHANCGQGSQLARKAFGVKRAMQGVAGAGVGELKIQQRPRRQQIAAASKADARRRRRP